MKVNPKGNRAREAAFEYRKRALRREAIFGDSGVHPKQDEFVNDQSPTVLASCSRRAGKSHGTARKIIATMERHPRSISVYIVQAREQAKDIIWPPLQKMSDNLGLGLQFKEHTGEVVHPNGAKLVLRGASTTREVEKLRGLAYPLAIIDEAQSFSTTLLKYMVEDALDAAMMDYGDAAQICLIGTPNAACAGHFYNMIQSGDFPHYHWTCLDNPFLPDVQKFLARKRHQFGGETPTYLREFRGIWVRDKDALVFRVNDRINFTDVHLKTGKDWSYTLGVDFGFNDPTAFVVLGYSREEGRIDVVESFEESELTQARIASYISALDEKYDFESIVGDSQGYGKPLVEGLNREYGMSVKPAKKAEKAAHIELLNNGLRTGTMKFVTHANRELVEQLRLLQWDPEKMKDNKFAFLDGRFADHMADALVYAFRDINVTSDNWEENPPKYGTKSWDEAEEERLIRQREEQLLREKEELEWFDDFASGGVDF